MLEASTSGPIYGIPNISKNGNGYREEAMVMINFDGYKNAYQDHFIIHELNHVIELYFCNNYTK